MAYAYLMRAAGLARYVGVSTRPDGVREREHMKWARLILRGRKPAAATMLHDKMAAVLGAGKAITFEIIERMPTKQAYAREEVLIAEYRARFPGQMWNMTTGGNGYPFNLTPEAYAEMGAKVSAAQLKVWRDPKYRKRTMKARTHYRDPEYRARMSAIAQARWTPEFREAYRKRVGPGAAERSRKRWKDNREAMMAPLLEAMCDPEYRANMSAEVARRYQDPEYAERHRAGCVAAQHEPEQRKRKLEQLAEMHADPEVQARRLASIRAYYARRAAEEAAK